jgi:hypothetical protein
MILLALVLGAWRGVDGRLVERFSPWAQAAQSADTLPPSWSFPSAVNDDSLDVMQQAPALARDSLGNLHAVWVDARDDGPRGSIYYARRAAGAQRWDANQRVAGGPGPEARMDPALVVDAVGRVHVVWIELHGGDPDVYHSLLPAGGRVWSVARRINDDEGHAIQWHPTAAADLWGTAHFAWTDYRAGSADIFSTRATTDDWWAPNVRVNEPAAGDQQHPQLAGGPSGDIYAVWQDTRTGESDIFSSRLPPGGSVWWPNARLSVSAAATLQRSAVVAADSGGAVHALWVDEGGAEGPALRQATQPAGEPYWAPDQVIYRPTNGLLLTTALAVGPGGEVLALWGETRPDASRIYSGLVSSDGTLLRERVDSSPTVSDGTDPAVVIDGAGRASALWRGMPAGGASSDVYSSVAQLAPPFYGPIVVDGWLQYRNGEDSCAGEGYVVVSCDGVPSQMIVNPSGLNLASFVGLYAKVNGVLKDRDGCPRIEAAAIVLAPAPCPRRTGSVTGLVQSGNLPVAGAAVHLGQETVRSGVSGRYFFDLIPAGRYPVSITTPCALVTAADSLTVREGVLTDAQVAQVVRGDVTGDCAINLYDLVTLAGQYKMPPPFRPSCADLDTDGSISLFDLVTVARGYDKQCPQPWLGVPGGTASAGSQATDRLPTEATQTSRVTVDPDAAARLGLAITPARVVPAPPRPAAGSFDLRLAGAKDVYGWSVELSYDPRAGLPLDADLERPGLQPFALGPSAADLWQVENLVDAATGRLRLTVTQLGDGPALPAGARLATVQFGAWVANARLSEVVLADTHSQPAVGTVRVVATAPTVGATTAVELGPR